MSGSGLSPWSIAKDSDYHLELVAKSVNCDPNNLNSFELITCLRSKSVEELLKSEEQLHTNDDHGYHGDIFKSSFGPIIDGLLIVSDPINLMESYSGNDSNHNSIGGKQLVPQSSSFSSSSASASGKKLASHSLLAGVTRSEYPFIFTQSEEDTGLDNDSDGNDGKSDSILYNLITSIVDYYQEVSSLELF